MSILGEPETRLRDGEGGRGRVPDDTKSEDGRSGTFGGVGPETALAKVRGLVGGVVDIATTLGTKGGTTGLVTVGTTTAGRAGTR